jgi:hypothetical protein
MRKRADWMNSGTDPLLEWLDANGMAASMNVIELDMNRSPGSPPAMRTLQRALDDLLTYGFVTRALEAYSCIEITPRGREYLAGDLDADAVEAHPFDYYAGTREDDDPVFHRLDAPGATPERRSAADASTDGGPDHSSVVDWGGSGPADRRLAVRLLGDATGDDDLAETYADAFVDRVVSGLEDDWRLSAEQVRQFVRARE